MRTAAIASLLAIAASACAAAAADPADPIAITNGAPGAFTVTARVDTKLQTVAAIEALRDGKWTDVSSGFDLGTGYRLVERCGGQPARCVELAPKAKLSPVAWSGMSCSSQCNRECDKNAPLAAGDYRLVVRTCDGATSVAGPAFHFDGKPR
jgi:hypothetical protein